jgi:Zn-dependent peptidase ImmA (M78 family)
MEEIGEWNEVEEAEQTEEVETHAPAIQTEVRAAYCRRVAQRILRDHKITEPPVPVDKIARAIGFDLQLQDLPAGVDARLQIIDSRLVMELARGQGEVRHRFSIAHELGHYFLGHKHNEYCAEETEANIFAEELLVPRAWLRKDVERYSIAELLSRYQVSREVLFIAAKDARLLNRLGRPQP